MTSFNGFDHINEQINSVLKQLEPEDELIICDDLSEDKTANVIQKFANDKRVIFKRNSKRLGVVRNFEQALSLAKGDFIFLCDQDDVWLDNKILKTIEALQRNLLVVSDCKVVDKHLIQLHPSFFEIRGSGTGIFKNIYKNSYLGCCMAFRKELLPYILPIPNGAPMHDMWIGLIAETIGKVRFIKEPLLLYRRHGNNVSPTADKSNFTLFEKFKFRLTLCILLLRRYLKNIFRKLHEYKF